ncbi:PAS and ANTAR domain-containing protein [Cellulosimicrobium cellulans]|uniref:PAS and ANTAR domain-containing protein n=1 Tax=Cellulosimicrobium cellulans TaxID=1710 RepID=UPI002097CD43|nr:PAS and ANTAR domain-containing protein [Cellulosimicrobium cellulans]MCO7273301.1 PAS and ANTAR domain-containing protein [Cellulosimicrobium cellulans]
MSLEDHATLHPLSLADDTTLGQYRVDLATDTWWWSAETYRLHGFEPGDVVPTTSLVLAHKHPDDRERVRDVLERARRDGAPFSSLHRIMDARGRERVLVVVGQGRRDRDTGRVVELLGYFVDVTRPVRAQAGRQAQRDITAAADSRGPIEQAKGVVAATLGVRPEQAFALLRRASNERNVRLRELARQVVEEGTRPDDDRADRVAVLLS